MLLRSNSDNSKVISAKAVEHVYKSKVSSDVLGHSLRTRRLAGVKLKRWEVKNGK